ncbi:histidine decarboxylase [Candidatus Saccharibacteria bacterium]|nr:histidine decarboxylase [Candidatus Saccharibacteria bacterium]
MEEVQARLDAHKKLLKEKASKLLGYPESMHFDYKPLYAFMDYNIDNLGDPFSDLIYGVNSTGFEREVIEYFAKLYHIPMERAWGYVTSCGSEGNLYGLFLGRELYPDAILYYSADTHYSVAKAGRLLNMSKVAIESQSNGEINYEALERAILLHPLNPVVICANIGTTVTGAIDDVDKIVEILKRNNIKNFYIHCDAALSGMLLPFMDDAPQISFEKPIGSVSISGHKFIGAPYPCGIVVARKEHVEHIQTQIEYIGALDDTIGGSRNGQAPIFLWYELQTRGANDGFRKEVKRSLMLADYLYSELKKMGYPCAKNPHGITVVFKEPSEQMIRKWSLARQNGRAHVITVPSASRSKIDAFLKDLKAEVAAANGQ